MWLSKYTRQTQGQWKEQRSEVGANLKATAWLCGFQLSLLFGSVSSRRDWRSINNTWVLGKIFWKENVVPCDYSVSLGKRKLGKEKLQATHSGRIGLGPGSPNENEFSIGVAKTNYQKDSWYIFFKWGGRKEGTVIFIKISPANKQLAISFFSYWMYYHFATERGRPLS